MSNSNVSDDVLSRNPEFAEALSNGEWHTPKKTKKKPAPKDEKDLFIDALVEFAPTIPLPIGQGGRKAEFRPIPGRAHKVDWAWPEWKVIVEVDGGNMGVRKITKGRNAGKWIPTGRHTKDDDYWKINEITSLGYTVCRFTTTQLRNRKAAAECVSQLRYYLKSKGFIK